MASKKSGVGGRRSKGAAARSGRSRRRPAQRDFEITLRAIIAALKSTRARWGIIGGIAVIARGVKRFTNDIDLAVRGDEAAIHDVAEALAREGIVPRTDDAEDFARRTLVFLCVHAATRVEIDLSFAWTAFEHEALDARSTAPFGSVRIPVVQAEDLVIYKVFAGRPQDLDDARRLLLLYPKVDRKRVRRHLQELAHIVEDTKVLDRLHETLASVKGPGRRGR